MKQTEQPVEVQAPDERAEIVAALACLVSVVYLFAVGEAALAWLQGRWAGLLAGTLLPLALTFTILHGSCCHREMRRAVRELYLALVSLLIFGGVCLALGILAFITVAMLPLSRFHY